MRLNGLKIQKIHGQDGVCLDDLKEIEAITSKFFYEKSAVSQDLDCENNERWSVCDIDADKYSSLRKLLRITVYCLKFIKQRVLSTWSHSTKQRLEISVN